MLDFSSHPIDVVKTRLQVSGDGTNGARNYKALGIRGTINIIATEVHIEALLITRHFVRKIRVQNADVVKIW